MLIVCGDTRQEGSADASCILKLDIALGPERVAIILNHIYLMHNGAAVKGLTSSFHGVLEDPIGQHTKPKLVPVVLVERP